MTLVALNVSGLLLQLPLSLLQKGGPHFLSETVSNEPVPFVAVNPYAFLVVVDYLRHQTLYIPRNVSTALVKMLLDRWHIPYSDAALVLLETERDLVFQSEEVSDEPPVYNQAVQELLQIQETKSGARSEKAGPAWTALQSAAYARLETLVFQHLARLFRTHLQQGHSHFRFYLVPPGIHPHHLVSAADDQDRGFQVELLHVGINDIPDMGFLQQELAIELLESMVLGALEISRSRFALKSTKLTARIENAFGLFETCTIDALALTFTPN
ncbi:hypothetical protein HDV03_001439 [Kappamyces sp. JEL0829]|nr:hypothetical protein HDV03_001439 [Kappamyces sp. JEL0829]